MKAIIERVKLLEGREDSISNVLIENQELRNRIERLESIIEDMGYYLPKGSSYYGNAKQMPITRISKEGV